MPNWNIVLQNSKTRDIPLTCCSLTEIQGVVRKWMPWSIAKSSLSRLTSHGNCQLAHAGSCLIQLTLMCAVCVCCALALVLSCNSDDSIPRFGKDHLIRKFLKFKRCRPLTTVGHVTQSERELWSREPSEPSEPSVCSIKFSVCRSMPVIAHVRNLSGLDAPRPRVLSREGMGRVKSQKCQNRRHLHF
jgi:hypothetical protein